MAPTCLSAAPTGVISIASLPGSDVNATNVTLTKQYLAPSDIPANVSDSTLSTAIVSTDITSTQTFNNLDDLETPLLNVLNDVITQAGYTAYLAIPNVTVSNPPPASSCALCLVRTMPSTHTTCQLVCWVGGPQRFAFCQAHVSALCALDVTLTDCFLKVPADRQLPCCPAVPQRDPEFQPLRAGPGGGPRPPATRRQHLCERGQ